MLPGYQSPSLIYESASTEIYRALREADQQSVIFKTSRKNYPSTSELARYQQEYRVLRKVTASGAIEAYDLQPYQNKFVLVLEDCGGMSLKQYQHQFNEQPFSFQTILQLGIQIVEQLHHIHRAHVVHKDINPANILYMPLTHHVKLIDFGMAGTFTAHVSTTNSDDPRLMEGTLAYLAPEQTGRINHRVDYRADFYALGITLYELLTQCLPFQSNDPLELIHGHIAKEAIAPHHHNPQIPSVLSRLVMKLMAKNPDDRYQSAWGLKADLQTCLQQWEAHQNIAEFELAREDIPQQFWLSQTLYGRESIQTRLNEVLLQSVQGKIGLTLITGPSGMGKSAIVHSIKPLLTEWNGYFLAGKCEQFQQHLPYAALTAALSIWVEKVLTLAEDQFNQHRQTILETLGSNSQLMIEMIPVLASLIGPQEPPPALPPTESQRRFEWVFLSFMRALCQEDHPIVLFMDDLQWADRATLKLIELMVTDDTLHHLLMIGAYRDTELTPTHPLHSLLHYLERADQVHQFVLAPLTVGQVSQLIVDSFGCDPLETQPFATLVHQKTSGHPFFVHQFLRSLHQENLLTLSSDPPESNDVNPDCNANASSHLVPSVPRWQWDLDTIQTCSSTENVATLVIQQLAKLPPKTQQLLSWAACLGYQFNLIDLADVLPKATSERSFQTVSGLYTELQTAIDANLIGTISGVVPPSPLSIPPQDQADTHKPSTHEHSGHTPDHNPDHDLARDSDWSLYRFSFIHDQVQQAILDQLDPAELQFNHHTIGQWLGQRYQESPANSAQLFQWVDHLNIGHPLLRTPDEIVHLVQLNLDAGKKAMATTAYASACAYFNKGLSNLPSTAWTQHHTLTYELHYCLAEAEQRRGHFAESEQVIDQALAHLSSPIEQATIKHLLILQYTLETRYEDAIAIGKQALALLDSPIPEDDLEAVVETQLAEFRRCLGDRPVTALLDNMAMTDPKIQATATILGTLQPTTYRTNPQLFMWVVTKLINLAIQDGDAPEVCYAYGAYGILLSGLWGEYERGYEFGAMSLELSRKLKNPMQECKACMVLGSFLNHWLHPLHTTESVYHDGYYAGLASGELQYVGYSLSYQSYHFFYQGTPLNQILDEIPSYLTLTQKSQNQWATDALLGCARIIRNLLGQTDHHQIFDLHIDVGTTVGTDADANTGTNAGTDLEQHYLETSQAHQSFNPLARYQILKAYTLYLYEEYEHALACIDAATPLLDYVVGTIVIPEYTFIRALTLAALYPQVDTPLQQKYWTTIIQDQQKLQGWAEHCAANFEHKYLLVTAEIHHVSDQPWDAMQSYDRAIASAHHYHCLPNEALAQDRAALFWQRQSKEDMAAIHRQKAYNLYKHWGAAHKIRLMKAQTPQLATDPIPTQPSLSALSLGNLSQVESITTHSHYSDSILNFETVIKASQALSSEIVLQDLLGSLLTIAMENAGAQTGVFLLNHDEQLRIEVHRHHDQSTLTHETETVALEECPYLPISLIQYIIRTQIPLVLEHAVDAEQFCHDPYIQNHHPQSILCMPIVRQETLIGILYLENNLLPNAFTHQHVKILDILANQAAISIQNSLLFQKLEEAKISLEEYSYSLEEKVKIRTQELAKKNTSLSNTLEKLKQTQLQLIQTEKLSSLGQMVAGIAHEINNPVSFIYGNLDPAQDYTRKLLRLISLYQHHYPAPPEDIVKWGQQVDIDFIQTDFPELLQSMEIGAERISNIITSLRNFSRLDESEQKQIDIHDGLGSTLIILKNRLQDVDEMPAIDVIEDYAQIPLIKCYASQINQVFMNIISNAIDALREPSLQHRWNTQNPYIHIQTRLNGDACEITISDNGPGIPNDIKPNIFDPFFTTKPVGSGTGLGLSIAHQIITQQHEGTLTCETSAEGTTFTIVLPICS